MLEKAALRLRNVFILKNSDLSNIKVMKRITKINMQFVLFTLILLIVIIKFLVLTELNDIDLKILPTDSGPFKAIHPFSTPKKIHYYVSEDIKVYNPSLLPITSTRFLAVGRKGLVDLVDLKYDVENKTLVFSKSTAVTCFMEYHISVIKFRCESPPSEMTFHIPFKFITKRYMADPKKYKWD